MNTTKRHRFSALTALAFAMAAGAPLATHAASCPGEKPESIVVNASGGAMAKSMRAAFSADFEKIHGITVIDTSPVDFGKLKAMVESGNVEWTVTEIGGQDIVKAEKSGLLEPIDKSKVDMSGFPKNAQEKKFAFAKSAYATVMGFSTEAFEGKPHPTTWAEFWDVKKFPGPRSLRNHPVDNLEYALMADGVAPDELYPLDLDRAFKKMDEIAPHITVWWKSGQQAPQLLIDGEVIMTSGWNGRFYNLIKDGAPMDIEWNQGMVKLSVYGIPKGARHACWGQEYLQVMTDPKRQAVYAAQIGYPGLHLDSPKYVDEKLAPYLPTYPKNIERLVWTDIDWWAENGEAVSERWNRWMLKNQ